ncbi:MAG TPA: helix-hairpin-helix domain-containing protein [Proteobacteria bacterium]|nr:helix-hairpin-helix domain-containing protein [Pseudomonadota bacterium]
MRKIVILMVLAVLFCWAGELRAQEIDVNSASSSELQRLKGVGAKKAQAIIAARDSGGSFTSLSNLASRVKGIGPKTVAKWENAVVIDSGESGQSPVPAPVSEAEDAAVTLNRVELIKEIASILKEHGYTNSRTNNSVAARIADYLKEKGGIILE